MTWPRYGKVVAVPHLCQMQLQAKDTGRSGIAVSPPVLCVDRLPRDAERVPDLLPRAAALPRGVAAGRQVTAVSTRPPAGARADRVRDDERPLPRVGALFELP